MKSYQVHYKLDSTNWWLATIPTLPGCHTQGRTLEQAERRIREALALFVSKSAAACAKLTPHVELPAYVRRTLDEAITKRAEAEALARDSQKALRVATTALTEKGISLRDIGQLLGVSRQRVHQWLDDP